MPENILKMNRRQKNCSEILKNCIYRGMLRAHFAR